MISGLLRPNTAPRVGSLASPGGIAIDARHDLYVADMFNNRILDRRDTADFNNGMPADIILGQSRNFQLKRNRIPISFQVPPDLHNGFQLGAFCCKPQLSTILRSSLFEGQ